MLSCINKNSIEYQTLKNRSGINDFILESVCRSFLEKYGRFPYLDELPDTNSEPALKEELKINKHNSTKIDTILSVTGTQTIEEANSTLNNQYRDLEVEITPLNKEAIIEINKRPTDNNFDNWTEEDEILAKAPRDKDGNLLAPNGKVSNLTEKQYAQVRTKAFKRWFGDWENDPANASKVVDENGEPLVVYHTSDGTRNPNFNIFDTNIEGRQTAIYHTDNIDMSFSYAGSIDTDNFSSLNFILSDVKQRGTLKDDDSLPFSTNITPYQRLKKALEIFNIVPKQQEDYTEQDIIQYIEQAKQTNTPSFYELLTKLDFINIKNPLIVECNGANWNNIKYKGKIESTRSIEAKYRNSEYDGIIFINVRDWGVDIYGKSIHTANNVYAAYKPNQIKSATDNSGLFNRQNNNIYDPIPNGYLVFTNALNKLASLYGIKFNDITDAELNSDKWKGIISDPSSVNAFVYNGQIYINIDRANLDAPIHEMMHLFVGSIRFQNPNLYTQLINLAESFNNYSKLAEQFKGRTRNDINEEIFIQEVSKYLVGLPSNISNLSSNLQYEISYNVKRLLDTILMGQDSVKTLSDDRIFSLSLNQIAQEVKSSIASNNFHGTLNVENSELHRKLNNIKSDLFNQGLLEEYCE